MLKIRILQRDLKNPIVVRSISLDSIKFFPYLKIYKAIHIYAKFYILILHSWGKENHCQIHLKTFSLLSQIEGGEGI